MASQIDGKRMKKPRIQLTDQDLRHLFEIRGTRSVPVLARSTGLPYLLVYNVVHRRVKSISDRYYRVLFGQVPPPRKPEKVDGAAFRAMVELWLFLNDDVTKSNLYGDFYGEKGPKKIDHRIFNGQTRTVEFRLERIMRKKFSDAGIEGQQLERWIAELETLPRGDRVPYGRIRPILRYLQEKLEVHPSFLLKQPVDRYETGMLKRVSRNTYEKAVALKRKAEKVFEKGGNREIEKLKEEISGGKAGYTLYLNVREELQFLCRYAKKSAKSYLGRGLWTYENGKARRIADWRARRIIKDCDRFIRKAPQLPLYSLPRSGQAPRIRKLLDVLVARAAQLLCEPEGLVFEKRVLMPSRPRVEYRTRYCDFTPFDMASGVLGMKKKAFDLMVAKNCDIFRSVGRYEKRWYLSGLYLKELSKNELFELISAKYELMAKTLRRGGQSDGCMN